MRKAVIFNGPPGSGKDLGSAHVEKTYGAAHHEMKYKLIEITRSIYCLSQDEWEAMYTRKKKEQPQLELDGRSPRQAIIHIAEDVIKPKFGKAYFGRATAKMLNIGLNSVSDGGFTDEVIEFSKLIGPENILVLRVSSPGCSWNKDSRSYFDESVMREMGIRYFDIHNDRTKRFMMCIDECIKSSTILDFDTRIGA